MRRIRQNPNQLQLPFGTQKPAKAKPAKPAKRRTKTPQEQRQVDIIYWKKVYAHHSLSELDDRSRGLNSRIIATKPSQVKKRLDLLRQLAAVEGLMRNLKRR